MSPRIVVVEDEMSILEIVRDVLEMEGYVVLGVSDPAILRTIDLGVRPGLFLIDVMLPNVSGIEVAQELRDNGFTSTPMIAMSASKLMLSMAAESHLFDDVLDKPFDLSTLLERVNRHVSPLAPAPSS